MNIKKKFFVLSVLAIVGSFSPFIFLANNAGANGCGFLDIIKYDAVIPAKATTGTSIIIPVSFVETQVDAPDTCTLDVGFIDNGEVKPTKTLTFSYSAGDYNSSFIWIFPKGSAGEHQVAVVFYPEGPAGLQVPMNDVITVTDELGEVDQKWCDDHVSQGCEAYQGRGGEAARLSCSRDKCEFASHATGQKQCEWTASNTCILSDKGAVGAVCEGVTQCSDFKNSTDCTGNRCQGLQGTCAWNGTCQTKPSGQPGEDVTFQFEIKNPLNANDIFELINMLSGYLVGLAIPAGVIMIIYAAFLFLTAGAYPENVTKARNILLYAVIGLAIIFIGAGFINLIQDILGVAQPPPA